MYAVCAASNKETEMKCRIAFELPRECTFRGIHLKVEKSQAESIAGLLIGMPLKKDGRAVGVIRWASPQVDSGTILIEAEMWDVTVIEEIMDDGHPLALRDKETRNEKDKD